MRVSLTLEFSRERSESAARTCYAAVPETGAAWWKRSPFRRIRQSDAARHLVGAGVTRRVPSESVLTEAYLMQVRRGGAEEDLPV